MIFLLLDFLDKLFLFFDVCDASLTPSWTVDFNSHLNTAMTYPPQSHRLRTRFPRNRTWECSTSTTDQSESMLRPRKIIICFWSEGLNRRGFLFIFFLYSKSIFLLIIAVIYAIIAYQRLNHQRLGKKQSQKLCAR